MTGPDGHGVVGCEVWWATPSGRTDLTRVLDDGERHRAGRLRDTGDRERFVTARALLRLLLTERTGAAPGAHHVDTTCPWCGADHGKPRLIGRDQRVHFSIAHSGGRVAVALADGVAVGVDVESVPDRGAEELTLLSTNILAAAELTDYLRLAPSARGRALAVWWTRKEAVLKATGAGLTVPMRDVMVSTPGEPAGLRGPRGSGRPMAALRDLVPDRGHVGCVAALGASSVLVTERDGDELLAGVALPVSGTMPP